MRWLIVLLGLLASLPGGLASAGRAATAAEAAGRFAFASVPAIAAGLIAYSIARRRGRSGRMSAMIWTIGVAILCDLALLRLAMP